MNKNIEIIQPDDWHVHFREGDMLEMVTNLSSRINNRCVAMPNTEIPITDTNKATAYKKLLNKASSNNFEPLIPCYLNENLELEDFRTGIQNKIFFGSKLYPSNATTNSSHGVNDISKRLIGQLEKAISNAKHKVKNDSLSYFNFKRVSESIRPEIAIGTHGIGVFASNETEDTGYSCETYDGLKLLVSNCLRSIFPDLINFRTLYTDTMFGNELPSSSNELISSCIHYGIDKLAFGSKKIHFSDKDRKDLLMSSAVRLCRAISFVNPSEDQLIIYFKRYNAPVVVKGLEREILSLVSSTSTVQEIVKRIKGKGSVLGVLREMQRKKLITISLL